MKVLRGRSGWTISRWSSYICAGCGEKMLQGQVIVRTKSGSWEHSDCAGVLVYQPCVVPTNNGQPCSIPADRYRNERWYCHIHDPEGAAAENRKLPPAVNYFSGPTHDCVAITSKGTSCSIDADRERDGLWYCHVHDPEGKAVQNVLRKREERLATNYLGN